MPKILELTIELKVQSVSCPGVWLCQDGCVSLTIYTLGTSYQTCMLPPIFPLMFKDVFYFRKRFENLCTFNNICCILKNETLYCELAQWSESCSNKCTILAQYLGSLNQVLFPPNTCSADGVDLLMRRSRKFPGILSPKIEVSTKVRLDEIWSRPNNLPQTKVKPKCSCPPCDEPRQRPVCHSARYHRLKCLGKPSRSSGAAKSCCSLKDTKHVQICRCAVCPGSYSDVTTANEKHNDKSSNNKIVMTSMYVDCESDNKTELVPQTGRNIHSKTEPCICEICQRYHQLFHA